MTVSSTKNRCRNLAALALALRAVLALALSAAPALAGRAADLDFKAQFESRLGLHAFQPNDPAMFRQTVELEQSAKFSREWSFAAGVRGYVDGVYATSNRYMNEPVRRLETADILLRDLYVQYRRPSLLVRLGNQQVVWGETFGFYFADIVNPKDLRLFGIGDLAAQRLQTPMLNTVFFLDKMALQLIALPKPFFNKNPALGSDYALPFRQFFPGMNVSVVDDRSSFPIATGNLELGARVSSVIHGVDLALFFFNYFNRAPEYELNFSPPSATFTARHSRLSTAGLTGTYDWGAFVTRWETLYTHDQPVDAFGYDPTNPVAYGTFKSDLLTGVLGIDYTQIPSWRLGLQISHKHYASAIAGALTPRDASLATLSVDGPIWHDQNLGVLLSYVPEDGSSLLQLSYLIPASSQFEVVLGGNLFFGGTGGQFGRYHGASQGYLQLRAYFSGS